MASTRLRLSRVTAGLVLPATAALLMLSSHAAAQKQSYIEVHGGLSHNYDADVSPSAASDYEIGYDDGLVFGAAIGGVMEKNWRAEAELTIRRNSVDESGGAEIRAGDAHFMTVIMVNLFRDFHNESGLTPYVGGGIGFGTFYSDDAVVNHDTDLFAYQLGAGIGLPLGERVTATLDYRLFGTSDAEFKDRVTGAVVDMDYLNSSIWVGLRFSY